jgi:SAM-dependent methyltransferase
MIIHKQLKNRKEVYNFITGDKILDVGGGSLPCGKANYIIDIMPYEFANLKESWPFFEKPSACKKENYSQHDICSRKPFPYPDKFFDFSICSHTLEDIRDPIWVLSEIARVSKAGYIETPSKQMERSKVESNYFSGYYHHRWLIELNNDKVKFYFKYAFVHAHFMFSEKPKTFSEMTMNFIWKDNIEGYEHANPMGPGIHTLIELSPNNNVNLAEEYNLRIHSNNYFLRKIVNRLKKIIVFRYIINLLKKSKFFQNILNIKYKSVHD